VHQNADTNGELCQHDEIVRPVPRRRPRGIARLPERITIASWNSCLSSCRPRCAAAEARRRRVAGDLIGSVRGDPRDASTNKRYLDEAILADYYKRAKKCQFRSPNCSTTRWS
jgi:hypothetical protein